MPNLGIEPAKLLTLGWTGWTCYKLQKLGNINGYHQLGLLTSECCADFLMSLSKVVKSTHNANLSKFYIFERAYNINGSNISSEIVHLLKVKLPQKMT